MSSGYVPIEETSVFKRFVFVGNSVWTLAMTWNRFAQDTVGKQLVRALDSVGANLSEGDGRYGDADSIRFFYIARASAREAAFFVARAQDRSLISAAVAADLLEEIDHGGRELNRLIDFRIRTKGKHVREDIATYGSSNHGNVFESDLDDGPNNRTPNAE